MALADLELSCFPCVWNHVAAAVVTVTVGEPGTAGGAFSSTAPCMVKPDVGGFFTALCKIQKLSNY